jgi:hypothetical protein
MKPITIIPIIETQHWKFFCNHFAIPYRDSGDIDVVDNIVITDCVWLSELWKNQKQKLYSLLKNNHVLLVGNVDSPVILKYEMSWMKELDQEPEAKNITCVIESAWFDHGFKNISVALDPESRFIELVEQRISLKLSKNITKDFLLTMGRHAHARDVIWEGLSDVGNNSIMVYHRDGNWGWNQPTTPAHYVGEDSAPMLWQKSMVPSLDLYNQCAFEVSSETLTTEGSWFTEKTWRPIAAKMPMVLMSVPGSLKELRTLGFKTFGNYIDESYDTIQNETDRALKVVATVKDIVANGSAEFANSVAHVTEHNWNRLVELRAWFQIHKDQRFLKLLDSLSLSPR